MIPERLGIADKTDSLIDRNHALLARAAEVRIECRHRQQRCRELLLRAQASYDGLLQRMQQRHEQRRGPTVIPAQN